MQIPKQSCGVSPVIRLVAKNAPIMGRTVATPSATDVARMIHSPMKRGLATPDV
jgi:hypothetical protein